jgi:hypothetical protein
MADMTADECHHRAREAKALAVETQDLWEREMLFKIGTQWQLVAAHRAAKKAQPVLKLVPRRSSVDHSRYAPRARARQAADSGEL